MIARLTIDSLTDSSVAVQILGCGIYRQSIDGLPESIDGQARPIPVDHGRRQGHRDLLGLVDLALLVRKGAGRGAKYVPKEGSGA